RQVPVEHARELVAVEARVVRRDIVVPDQRGFGDGEISPRPGVAEASDSGVERPGPANQRHDLAWRKALGFGFDDMSGHIAEHLTAPPINAEHTGNAGKPPGKVPEQCVNRWSPRPCRPTHRGPDAHRAADVARELLSFAEMQAGLLEFLVESEASARPV